MLFNIFLTIILRLQLGKLKPIKFLHWTTTAAVFLQSVYCQLYSGWLLLCLIVLSKHWLFHTESACIALWCSADKQRRGISIRKIHFNIPTDLQTKRNHSSFSVTDIHVYGHREKRNLSTLDGPDVKMWSDVNFLRRTMYRAVAFRQDFRNADRVGKKQNKSVAIVSAGGPGGHAGLTMPFKISYVG